MYSLLIARLCICRNECIECKKQMLGAARSRATRGEPRPSDLPAWCRYSLYSPWWTAVARSQFGESAFRVGRAAHSAVARHIGKSKVSRGRVETARLPFGGELVSDRRHAIASSKEVKPVSFRVAAGACRRDAKNNGEERQPPELVVSVVNGPADQRAKDQQNGSTTSLAQCLRV
jgi:hypothetical protein